MPKINMKKKRNSVEVGELLNFKNAVKQRSK